MLAAPSDIFTYIKINESTYTCDCLAGEEKEECWDKLEVDEE